MDPVNPYSSEHPYNNNPEDSALNTKYFIPDSVDLKLSLSIDARIYNDRDCNSNPKFELTIKNIHKIDKRIIIGYSNLSNLLYIIKFFEELRTKNDDKSIKILK